MKVFIIAAITTDGFIALERNHPADWTSKEDKKLFVELTKRAGVVIMGRNTYETIGKALPHRLNIVYTSRPLDNPQVQTTQENPEDLIRRLEQEGYQEVAVCGGQVVYDLFLKSNMVDEIYMTIEPKLFGVGISLAKSFMKTDLKLINYKKLNDDTLNLHYKVVK